MASYLDFEQGIKQIDDDIANARIRGDEHAVEILNKNLEKETAKFTKILTSFSALLWLVTRIALMLLITSKAR